MPNQLTVTSLNTDDLKSSLIEFVQQYPEFADIDYEGSAINTIIDLLIYDATKISYQANMVANESFLDTAQLRRNVVSHAQKLSYVPKSPTASRLICNLEVIPSSTTSIPTSIVMEAGTQFIASSGDTSFTFVNNEPYVLSYSNSTQSYRGFDIELFQGQRLTETYDYLGNKLTIPNTNADTSTMLVSVGGAPYKKATSIDQLSNTSLVYFLGENQFSQAQIEFGSDILGVEPANNSEVTITYIATEEEFANGLTNLTAASTIADYSNIVATVTTAAYGGGPRETMESIRFMAPKLYQAQDRALTDTDYIPILKAQFPFVASAISWGGETNTPPAYGTVFISIISDSGNVTTAVKQQMISYLSSKNVGSVTPTIVDPVTFNANLSIKFSYDNRRTNLTFNGLVTEINNIVSNYNDEIADFGLFLNPSELIARIKDVSGITSVDVDKVVYQSVDVLNFADPVYTVSFANPVREGSLSAEGFTVANNSSDTKIYDDEEGNVVLSYIDSSSIEQINNVGTIDYETGEVEFSINIIDNTDEFKVFVTPVEENFYVTQNRVIQIDETEVKLIQTTNR